jgi:hypothetical protein
MTQIRATLRPLPVFVEWENTLWDWETMNKKLSKAGFFVWIALLFVKRQTVLAPRGTPCGVTTLGGVPILTYKTFRGKAYQLLPYPGPGFPGN